MRDDSLGFFWEDLQQSAKRGQYARPIPPIPDNGWVAPKEFPRLADVKLLAIDTETKDTELTTMGPGFRRTGDTGANIVGLAVGTEDGGRWYFPMRHTIAPEQNLDPGHVLAWARDNICSPGQTKVGANLMYDVDALWTEGVPVTGPFIDVQFAEALLDENRFSYSLENLLQDYFSDGKVKDELQAWVERAYGDADGSYRANIWRAPPCLVGPYAEGDVDGPLRLWAAQKPKLAEQGLTELFDLESELIEPLVHMRQYGVRVDVEYAKRLDDELTVEMNVLDQRLQALAGRPISVTTPTDIALLFDKTGAPYGKTATGKPSFTKLFLEQCNHPAALMIVERRKLQKYRDTFVRGYVLNLHVNGRIHALFHPLKGDENGTVSGRFSSSLPNLQNIPVRDPVWGPKLRALFLPEPGQLWLRHDWSQIEYRFLGHYAQGPTGADVRKMYNENPDTDFHEMTLDMVAPVAHWDISTPDLRKQSRKPVKNINFGLCYGMGQDKLTGDLGLNRDEGAELFKAYHTAVPFVKDTYNTAQRRAQDRGYIRTVLNRRARFPLWEPRYAKPDPKTGEKPKALRHEAALEQYGENIVRAFTHKTLNRLLQGSAADLMKLAMRDMWRAGLHNIFGHMLLTCHDETGHSMDPSNQAHVDAANEVKHIMETCLKLRVPIRADQSTGGNWGECK